MYRDAEQRTVASATIVDDHAVIAAQATRKLENIPLCIHVHGLTVCRKHTGEDESCQKYESFYRHGPCRYGEYF